MVLPAPDHLVEVLDFTGRHERERNPQRHEVTDGLWLRESPRRAGPGSAPPRWPCSARPGFSTTYGEVLGVHVGLERQLRAPRRARPRHRHHASAAASCCCPARSRLAPGESYATPWVHVAAADDGLDGLAAAWHAHQRSLPAHPAHQPVVLNVWEAVYFDHDLARLKAIADRAARIGVERFVLDDGWFHGAARRHRRARRLDASTRRCGPRASPRWSSTCAGSACSSGSGSSRRWSTPTPTSTASTPTGSSSAGDRVPLLHRNQLVLDLSPRRGARARLRPDQRRCCRRTRSTR